MRTINPKKNILMMIAGFVIAAGILVGGIFALSPVSQAQVGIDPNLGATFGLGTADLQSTVINVVQWALGFLGLIAVIFIMYGGFIWMTAAGNQDKVAKAKKIITRAVIGLVIVLLSWAIVTFIVDRALNLTGGDGGGCTLNDVNGCYLCLDLNGDGFNTWEYQTSLCGAGTNTIRTVWRDPEGPGAYVCQIVQAQFNAAINSASVAGNARLIDMTTSLPVSGTWQVAASDQRLLEFLPDANFADTTEYRVELDTGIQFTTAGVWAGESWTFTTSDEDLTTPPTVININPTDGDTGICLNGVIQMEFSQKMRAASINDATVLFNQLNPTPGPADLRSFSASNGATLFSSRPSTPMDAGAQYSVELLSGETVDDLDPLYRDPTNSVMDVCLNHLDGNASGLEEVRPDDNYMDPTNPARPWDFTADTDVTNTQCLPEVHSIDQDGLYRSDAPRIAIRGSNFGLGGYVDFNSGINVTPGGNNYCFNAQEYPANSCLTNTDWTDTEISLSIPGGPLQRPFLYPSAGAMDGAVAVSIDTGICAGGDLDGMSCNPLPDSCPGGGICRTSANTVTHNVASPQIHNASARNNQAHGGVGQMVSLLKRSGADDGFGAATGNVEYISKTNPANRMNATLASCTINWSNSAVLLQMTDLSSIGVTPCDVSSTQWYNCPDTSRIGIQITRAGGFSEPSNIIEFIYTNEEPGPGLCAITPLSCGVNSDVRTFEGFSFGPATGSAAFTLGTNPPVNAAVGGWDGSSDPNTAQVSIPNLANAQNYLGTIANANGIRSNGVYFDVPCGDIPEVLSNPSCSAQCVDNLGNPNGNLCSNDSDCNVGAGETCQIQMASPNPFTGSNEVCTNAVFGARFRVAGTNNPIAMNSGTMTPANILLEDCGSSSDCSGTVTLVSGYTVNPINAPLFDRFLLTPSGNLNPDTYYRVTINQGVLSSDGAMMNAPFSWIIHTKPGTEVCPLESVSVSPAVTVLTLASETRAYTGMANGPNCALLNPASYTWSWVSTVPSIAAVSGSTSPIETATVPAAPSPPNAGSTYIQATADGVTGQGRLRVDPDSCAFNESLCYDPVPGGPLECPDSYCDLVADRCTPSITNISPQTGPNAQFVTINGCYFGNAAGVVRFGGTDGILECTNAWNNDTIIVTEPGNPNGSSSLIDVVRTDGFSTVTNSNQTGPAYQYTVTAGTCAGLCDGGINAYKSCAGSADCPGANCSPGVSVPSSGPPGICAPLVPAAGRENTLIDITGANFNPPGGPNPSQSRIYYSQGLQDSYAAVIGRGSWTGSLINDTQVPVGAISGPISVQVNNCPSNEVNFSVSCTRNSQCGTGCCDLASNSCRESIYCSSGGVGDRCTIDDGTNPNCAPIGMTFVPPDDMLCISNTGDLSGVPNPPPEPPPFGDDCRFCCAPGMTANGLTCTENVGECDGTGRGLYCGCTTDSQCTGGSACGNDTCCHGRPSYLSHSPLSSSCQNVALVYQFTGPMDFASFTLAGSIEIDDVTNGVDDLPGVLRPAPNGFSFTPAQPFAAGATIRVTLHRDQIRSEYGVSMSALPTTETHTHTISGSARICSIDRIDALYIGPGSAITPIPPASPHFPCSTDNCYPSDFVPPGAQIYIYAYPVDANGNELSTATPAIDVSWTETDPSNIYTPTHTIGPIATPCPTNQSNNFSCLLTSDNNSGTGYLNITADGTGSSLGDLGRVTRSIRIRSSLCSQSWPDAYSAGHDWPYEDSLTYPKPDTLTGGLSFYTNFSTWYCRDDGLAPLKAPGDLVVKEGVTFVAGVDNLIKEYFFLRDDSDDAIGIRVMENERNLSPRQWYYEQFGPAAPQPQALTVDGYPAVRSGRTVYVSAPNLQGATMYTNIYLISYSEGAAGDTIQIYNRLLENWEFNANMTADNKARLQRDIRRLADLSEIAEKLRDYKGRNDSYPTLEGGSYISTLSTSQWPSWQDTLGSQLSGDLPIDPINSFSPSCSGAFNADTCWNDTTREYQCPVDSNIYQYLGTPTGGAASLYARLEYVGVGSWRNYTGNPCAAAGISNATCGCFNYQYDVTGTATDRDGPIIANVNGVTPGGSMNLTGVVTMDVSVSDTPSGVDRVEFYVDDIRQATDDDGTNTPNWSWNFDTSRFTAGTHVFRVRAYDTVGNYTDASYTVTLGTAGGDTTAPFVEFINVADGDTIPETLQPAVRISDNVALTNATLSLRDAGGVIISGYETSVSPATNPQMLNLSLVGASAGNRILRAQATDTSGNTATRDISIVLAEIDTIAPTTSITSPAAGATLTRTESVVISATDTNGVVRVELFVDGTYAGQAAGSGPYVYDLNTRLYSNGSHDLTARAYDAANNVGISAPVTVSFNNAENDFEAPTVTFVSPPTPAAGSSVDGTITIRVDAQDNAGVQRVNFYLDYQWRTANATGEWVLDTTSIADGWHRIQVDAVDAAGNRSESIELRVNFRGPGGPVINAGLVDPASGAPGTAFCIQADVTSPTGISRVEGIIQYPDEVQIARVSLFLTGGSTYQGNWTSPSGGENSYFVDIEAESNDGYVSQLENVAGMTGACTTTPSSTNPPVITSSSTASGTVGTVFTTYHITATNTPTSYATSSLPAGLTLSANRIVGTPAASSVGTHDVTLFATNAYGTGSANLRITIGSGSGGSSCQICSYIGENCSGISNSTTCNGTTRCTWDSATGSCNEYNCGIHSGSFSVCSARSYCSCAVFN